MDFELLTEIIDAFKKHQLNQKVGEKTTISTFAIWLNKEQYLKGEPLNTDTRDIIGRNEVEIEIGKLIIYLNRYAKLLIKKGLTDFPELVNEDFTYLYILMSCESMTKIQLIEKNIHEKPTGLEVIKRLIKHKLIGERNDENDKRSKRVFLTEKGKATFFATLKNMEKVSTLITGKLTTLEKKQLFGLLKKLEAFHNPIFLNHRNDNLDELENFKV